MEFSWRTPFSRGPSDVQLTGVLGNGKNWGMYGEYQNDSKVPRYEPHDPPLEYRKDYPALPATRPVNFPHIIDMDRYYEKIQRQNLRMADAVVTVLYNWEQEALAAFLDLDREDFRFRVEMKGVNPLDFFIERKHRRVECGYVGYESHKYLIKDSGEWIPDSVIVTTRQPQERQQGPWKAISIPHSATDLNGNSKKRATGKPEYGKVRKGRLQGTAEAGKRTESRLGFVDKDGLPAKFDDGAKLADDVLALRIWEKGEPGEIKFKTIGVYLSEKREDTEVIDWERLLESL